MLHTSHSAALLPQDLGKILPADGFHCSVRLTILVMIQTAISTSHLGVLLLLLVPPRLPPRTRPPPPPPPRHTPQASTQVAPDKDSTLGILGTQQVVVGFLHAPMTCEQKKKHALNPEAYWVHFKTVMKSYNL